MVAEISVFCLAYLQLKSPTSDFCSDMRFHTTCTRDQWWSWQFGNFLLPVCAFWGRFLVPPKGIMKNNPLETGDRPDHRSSDLRYVFFFVQCAGYEKRWDFPGHDWFPDGSPLFSPCFLAETQMAKLSTSHWSSCIPSPFFKCWIRYVSMSWTRGKIQEHPSASGNGNDNLLAKHVPSNHINSSSWNLA